MWMYSFSRPLLRLFGRLSPLRVWMWMYACIRNFNSEKEHFSVALRAIRGSHQSAKRKIRTLPVEDRSSIVQPALCVAWGRTFWASLASPSRRCPAVGLRSLLPLSLSNSTYSITPRLRAREVSRGYRSICNPRAIIAAIFDPVFGHFLVAQSCILRAELTTYGGYLLRQHVLQC